MASIKITPKRSFWHNADGKDTAYIKGQEASVDEKIGKQMILSGWAEPVEDKDTKKAVSK